MYIKRVMKVEPQQPINRLNTEHQSAKANCVVPCKSVNYKKQVTQAHSLLEPILETATNDITLEKHTQEQEQNNTITHISDTFNSSHSGLSLMTGYLDCLRCISYTRCNTGYCIPYKAVTQDIEYHIQAVTQDIAYHIRL
ncbi:hypothetical protein CHS0354_038851 [Potamilus streckersoni]|uniref:Uncharacterized protein n=1 Tax=Potamilus streckersoni TaxID=2493646 RepID=A0AAE0TH23_9BIVA|nr:hypothetical protein CHS0354_038851 [Potamilus streckersoni]